jgi:hypothetical protein
MRTLIWCFVISLSGSWSVPETLRGAEGSLLQPSLLTMISKHQPSIAIFANIANSDYKLHKRKNLRSFLVDIGL